jgi:hypothetical protein
MRRFSSTLTVLFFLGLTSAFAMPVDWNAQTWTAGGLGKSLEVDPTWLSLFFCSAIAVWTTLRRRKRLARNKLTG